MQDPDPSKTITSGDGLFKITATPIGEIDKVLLRGGRRSPWDFPEQMFDGQWWYVETHPDQVMKAANSFRSFANRTGFKGHTRTASGKLFVMAEPKPKRKSMAS